MEDFDFTLSLTATGSKEAKPEEVIPENKEIFAKLTFTKQQVHFIFIYLRP